MRNTNLLKWTIVLVSSILLACRQNGDLPGTERSILKDGAYSGDAQHIRVQARTTRSKDDGNRNPYAVSSMHSALESLKGQGFVELFPVRIPPTHYYVRILPLNGFQYDELMSDSSIILIKTPLVSRVSGSVQPISEKPPDAPPVQYTAVPVSYPFTDTIPFEVLETLYLPEGMKN